MLYRDNGGLTVAEHSMSEQAVAAELRSFDPELRLFLRGRDLEGDGGPPCYEVHHFVSRDRPSDYLCSWWDTAMNPLPLSMGLVEKVKSLRREHQSARLNEVANQAIRDAADKEFRTAAEDIGGEMFPRISGKKKTLIHRSQALRLARDKSREQR